MMKYNILLNKQLKNYPNQQYLFVELGYNYQLQHQQEKATSYYEKALKSIDETPNLGYINWKNISRKSFVRLCLMSL